MKIFSIFKAALLTVFIPFLIGCEKEPLTELQVSAESELGKGKQVERPFKGRMVTSTILIGDEEAGWTEGDLLPAWFLGSGEGNATHIGKFNAYFSQYGIPVGVNEAQVVGAPVTMFFTDELSALFTPAEIALMAELEVSVVIYDKHGNSIWSARVPVTRNLILDDASRVEVYQELVIVGGTGRFAEASGSYILSGITEVSSSGPGKGEVQIEGVIVY
ncbi:hypothetical protein [uncultured Pontibacter sp.]|uniref:hypothetical protein n=1 Tax=uncultured Pontibacter sp. TaxID=453356 RepID=UPI00262BE42B|nr:hypothetical protein [uncultured Pontibacter sp.]